MPARPVLRYLGPMGFRFLHAADIHLDSPLLGLSRRHELMGRAFAHASRQALTNLVDRAIVLEVAFVVIAGDLFDGDWKDFSTGLAFQREAGRLCRAGIRLFVLHGNHDADSVISRRLPMPDGAFVFPSNRAATYELPEHDVVLHGRSFATREERSSLLPHYPAPVPGRFEIGVLHTACEGREGHASYAPCTVGELAAHGYDYWALGHVHAREILSERPHIVFPGNLQGRHANEPDAKGATLVTVRDGHVAEIEPITLDAARWASLTVDAGGLTEREGLLDRVSRALGKASDEAGGRPLALRLRLAGATRLHGFLQAARPQVIAEIEAIASHIAEDIWLERLLVATADPAGHESRPEADALAGFVNDLTEAAAAEAMAGRLTSEWQTLVAKLPPGLAGSLPVDDPEGRSALLDEARDLALARLTGAGTAD
ncbi:metallophosphoesterase family protein [Marinivivus vitaminiproducens]|uniref:metallophosphoesterase family protein n=1 Tax=Marinivivus vitaminiproducens TaxID=3035935 RepID=UPI0027A5B7FC|nr:DNA repair exonuclease [Geminicoccaceae bacterium SCSIO 64248]